jgi:diaminohydroxyphosphoribosylaminopyrimidine deaminase / 5-amino-6-(5-phosphoribosylamino)uracil reductase
MEHKTDRHWLAEAIELSRRCPPTDTAFCVGAILIGASGQVVAQAYSRQADPKDHAEEAALRTAAALGADLREATLYSSLEPCLRRASRPAPCAELILHGEVRRVVFAWREPPIFQPGGGAAWLAEHGVEVIELGDLAAAARAVNRPVLDRRLSPSRSR